MAAPRKKTPAKKPAPAKPAPKAKDKAREKPAPKKSTPAPAVSKPMERPRTPAPRPKTSMSAAGHGHAAPSTAVLDDELKAKTGKPILDKEFLDSVRLMLSEQRQRLVSVVASTQAQMAEKEGDLPDVSDRASEGFEDELAVGLMAVEAAKLEDIDAALRRIDGGSYGVCEDCRKAIPRKRLEFLPFARRCLACEGEKERRTRVSELQSEDEDTE